MFRYSFKNEKAITPLKSTKARFNTYGLRYHQVTYSYISCQKRALLCFPGPYGSMKFDDTVPCYVEAG